MLQTPISVRILPLDSYSGKSLSSSALSKHYATPVRETINKKSQTTENQIIRGLTHYSKPSLVVSSPRGPQSW